MTTINRKIRAAANRVLTEYGIDDLQLEIDITSAVKNALDDVLIKPEEVERGTMAALKRHEERREMSNVDLSGFPEDAVDVLKSFCNRWNVLPPARKKGGEYARWVECARDLKDACGEFDVDMILHMVYSDYLYQMSVNDGRPPYIVSGPCALLKVCRAKAGEIRKKEGYQDDPTDDGSSSFHF